MKSIVSYPDRGKGGSNSYRGNCSPLLISDLIDQFHFQSISDYMCGSGTTSDVAKEKHIECNCYDLHSGFDLLNNDIKERNESIFWHPPYFDMITYSDNMYPAKEVMDKYGYDPRKFDLSRCSTYEEFVEKMNYCCLKQYASLVKGGRLCVLVGDLKRKGKLYSMILDLVKPSTIENIVIKAQHNCWSDNVTYSNTNFIPIMHEYLIIFRKDNPLLYEIKVTRNYIQDVRDLNDAPWKDVLASVLEEIGRPAKLGEIYGKIEGYKKAANNPHYREKARQTLQIYPDIFKREERGVWKLAA